ncbi:Uncharacterised protein [uncultured archaeon]|nr:Uncharacterised protein [uncultured archaeon]
MMWKDWRVYAAAAAVTIAGLVYSCNKRFESGSFFQLSDVSKQVKESPDDCKTGECECIKLDKPNYQKFKSSLEQMVRAGASFSKRQMCALLSVADINEDNVIDSSETENLCRYYLNPDSLLGKLALPYRGPEPPPQPSGQVKGLSKLDGPVASEARMEKYLLALTDEDEDCTITEKETSRMAYKVKMAFDGR